MIDHSFRKILPRYTPGLIRLYQRLKITPNQLSVISFALAYVSAFLITRQIFLVAILIWWLGRLLDGTDGIYARATERATYFGAFLDMLCDMAAYSVMVLGFSVAFPEESAAWRVILFLYVLCITGALALGSLQEKRNLHPRDNRGLRLAAGLAEGGETGIAYTVFLLFPQYLFITVWIWVAVLTLTVLARTFLAHKELSE